MPSGYYDSFITTIMQDYTLQNKEKQYKHRQRHEFLLTFFDKPDKYEAKEINGFILVRYFSKVTNLWEVSIYTKEKWEKVQVWKQKQRLNQEKLL
jgi:hypothetical protein